MEFTISNFKIDGKLLTAVSKKQSLSFSSRNWDRLDLRDHFHLGKRILKMDQITAN